MQYNDWNAMTNAAKQQEPWKPTSGAVFATVAVAIGFLGVIGAAVDTPASDKPKAAATAATPTQAREIHNPDVMPNLIGQTVNEASPQVGLARWTYKNDPWIYEQANECTWRYADGSKSEPDLWTIAATSPEAGTPLAQGVTNDIRFTLAQPQGVTCVPNPVAPTTAPKSSSGGGGHRNHVSGCVGKKIFRVCY